MILTTIFAASIALGGPAPEPSDDRAWAASRPNRGVHASVIRSASLVPPRWRPFAECVVARESHGNPRAVNASGAAGIAQWMPAWRTGLPYVVRRSLVHHGMPRPAADAVRAYLARLPIQQWPAPYQWTALAQNLAEGQWQHWQLAGSPCNGLVAR